MDAGELGPPPRYGPLWCRAALRPFAEQLVTALVVAPGELVLDLSDDDGTTGALLRRRGVTVIVPQDGARDLQGASRPLAAVVAVRGGISTPPPVLGLDTAEAVGARQRLLCTWRSAPHEDAVRRAFGLASLAPVSTAAPTWADVVRFDTVDHLWAASLARADVARRAAVMSAAQLTAARATLRTLLSGYCTADATLRIPAVMSVR
ncbi:MAG: hypothetical protein NVSMB29_05780 [Candidatus Dormibacteria bacterium]